jgi:cohesin complex subunit SA-1/2
VGGSVESDLEQGTDLEELDDNEWDTLVTNVVEVMRETDADQTLLSVNPNETNMGAREYRAIYQEFWYRLGTVILSHSQNTASNTNDDSETILFSSNRFQVEMMRELVTRITELVLVGQPDLRAGATMAIWQLSISCMERTIELQLKLQVASRQFKSANKSQSRKLQALQHSMDAWKRHMAELEEIVEGNIFQGVFIHRYRDSNPYIRGQSMETLSKLCLLRPDVFLRDKYLKYFGWMASDKVASVRVAALQGLLAPFAAASNTTNKPPIPITLTSMQNVSTKFLMRIVDCTEDSQSLEVQEMAMELLLRMLQHEFLDEWEDDNGWDQVNMKALDLNTSPKVRKDALYFILEQLPSFDSHEDDNRSTLSSVVGEKKQAERVEGIAAW